MFEKWCEKLLDTGKRNRLINFKDSKLRTLEILQPEINKVFEKLSKGDSLTFYDVDDYIIGIKEDKIENYDGSEGESKLERIGRQQIIKDLSGSLKKNQVLAFKKGISLNKILGSLKKIASTSLVEKGINILYCAFGFLTWREKENSDYIFNSPLVLIPVALSNQSATSPFTMKEYEDEFSTNPTLAYKFKSEFNIILPEFRDEQNSEESIIDYFDRVQSAVSKFGWTVKQEIALGTFSFMKLDMYRDLKENEEKILANPSIQKLLNRKIENEVIQQKVDTDSYFKNGLESNLHNVVDADSSQMAAIVQAKAGNSFVLQGPPGTGKSQTITNLIAEFLYDGKKVLFVSEKLAALKVVYNNLLKVSLAGFCLQLHSNKTNKKDVINQLYKALNRNKASLKSQANGELEEYKKAKKQLDEYVDAMHTTQSCINKTPYEILGEISKNGSIQSFEFSINLIQNKGAEHLIEAENRICEFIKFKEFTGFDYRKNPWFGYINPDSTYQEKLVIKNQLSESILYLKELVESIEKLNDELGINVQDFNLLEKRLEFIRQISHIKFFDNNIFNKNKLSNIISVIKKYNEDVRTLEECKQKVDEVYNKDLYELDINQIYLKFKNDYISGLRFLNGKYRKDKKILCQYQISPKHKIKYKEIVALLKNAKNAKVLSESIIGDEKKIFNYLNQTNINENMINWTEVEIELTKLQGVLVDEFSAFDDITEKEFRVKQFKAKSFVDEFENSGSKRQIVFSLLKSFDRDVLSTSSAFDNLLSRFKLCIENFEEIENWIRFQKVLNELKRFELMDFIDLSIDKNVERETLDKIYHKMFYTQWLHYIINNNKVLSCFSRFTQDDAVEKFKQKDKLKFLISKAEIISKLAEEMPNPDVMASGSQVSTLVREANKKTKQKPVRLLFKEIGQLVQKLKPCFLMSPLSVSTYLDSETCEFDVVIFDEASQIFPWDAIGAISRTKQVIVVGDSKQMPPSNFFNAGMVEDEIDEENFEDDSLDFESILDLCTSSFSQNRLNWHYRSRTEELISFSNTNFYDSSLVTFPSAHKDNVDMGVDFCYVEDGIFNRKTRCNVNEAQKVVDLVFEHFKNYPERSLGVVAFSISQQDAIENLIQKQRECDNSFDEFFDSEIKEPFFVKNLETVQGDERDTIIFSVAYAKDSSGKFLHNFGPLNRKGGERRLNVAITRAKCNIKLVSSIKSLDIDLSKTSSVGAKLLKDYLDYAQNGIQEVKNWIGLDRESRGVFNFELEVCKVLEDAGYKVDIQVGCSDYKIDLGVKHPTKTDYVLAVECDGVTYRSAKTTRDRDRLRQEVLERLGWKFYRVWSTDWFINNSTEKKKLLSAVENAIREFDKKQIDSEVKQREIKAHEADGSESSSFIIEEEFKRHDLKSMFKKYQTYDIFSRIQPSFDDCVYDLVKTEAPITEELLLKKTVKFFGRAKVTNVVRDEFRRRMRVYHQNILKVDDYYVVDTNMKIELRIPNDGETPRDIMMISSAELSSGLNVIIKNNVGITKDGLFSTVTNLLGFTRKGNNIIIKLTESLDSLLKSGQVKEVNGEYFSVDK